MAGAYKLLMSRAKVTVTAPLDRTDVSMDAVRNSGVIPSATVSVRDGVATITSRDAAPITMDVASVSRTSGKSATITGTDGTTWEVKRGCGCGGSK